MLSITMYFRADGLLCVSNMNLESDYSCFMTSLQFNAVSSLLKVVLLLSEHKLCQW